MNSKLNKSIDVVSNENIFFMQKFNNFRNNVIKVDLPTKKDIVFQTFWSDFVHLSLLGKNSCTSSDKFGEFDYTNYNDDSYIVFQEANRFVDYKNEEEYEKYNLKIKEEGGKFLDISTTPNNNENLSNLTMITRIPQEFNIDIKTDGNIKIVNTGDSKLIADKFIKVEFNTHKPLSQTNVNIFETKRMRTENFYLNANDRSLFVNIRSYLEGNKISFISLYNAVIRIKKLGIVNEGKFNLKDADLDCRSIYGPKIDGKFLDISLDYGTISVGTIQGNIRININKAAKVVVDNLECKNFELNFMKDTDSVCEIFINDVGQSCIINSGNNKVYLYLNNENSGSFKIKTSLYSEDIEKEREKESEKKVIYVNSKVLPDIIEMSSWDYTRKKIESKLRERNNLNNLNKK